MPELEIPVIGFAAYSGTGKTTLLSKVVEILSAAGFRVGVAKHAHHEFDIDRPGKDSYRLRKAGATQVIVGSRHRWAMIVETGDTREPRLDEMLERLLTDELDLVLVEGFKPEHISKIELHRAVLGKPLLSADDPSFIAVASDTPANLATNLPTLDINGPQAVADFLVSYCSLQPPELDN